MDFSNLLKRRTITKRIDESQGDTPLSRIPEIQVSIQNVPTSFQSLNEDVILLATNVAAKAQDLIQELEEEFKEFDPFKYLALEYRARSFDPQQLSSNPNYRPEGLLTSVQLAGLERAVYEQTNSPRAAFYGDVWNILNELNILIWVYRKSWRQLGVLFDKFFNRPAGMDRSQDHGHQSKIQKNTRRSLFMDLEQIKRLDWELDRIRFKALPPVTPEFVESLAFALKESDESGNVRALLIALLQDNLILLSQDYEKFKASLTDSYGEWRSYASKKLQLLLPHSVLGTSLESVLKLTETLDTIADREDTQSILFRRVLEESLFRHLQAVEDDLLEKESSVPEHCRNLMHLNVEKAGMVKQFLEAVDSSTKESSFQQLIGASQAGNLLSSRKFKNYLEVVSNVQQVLDSIKDIKWP